MNRPPRQTLLSAALVSTVALLAACQAGGAGSPSGAASAGADADVSAGSSAELGQILVDAEGRTLYVFLNDSPGTSTCAAECAANWPPALTEASTPAAGDGVSGELGTIEREDGSRQLTLEGWPLYRYAGDAAPGDATGDGVNQVWFVARPDGSVPTPGGASAAPSATDSGDDDPYDY